MKDKDSADRPRYANVDGNLKAREIADNIRRIRCMKIDKALKEKRDQILTIAGQYGARNVRIFGSIARGEGKRASDLDVLVELDPGRSLLDIIAIKQDLEDLLNIKVDVVTEAAFSPYIRDEVLRQAISL
jgi:predicted nucleotidyltransferase